MKLFLISVGIAFVLLLGYLIVAAIVVIAMSPDVSNLNPSAVAMVDFPFRGPKHVYYYFFPPTAEDFSTNPQQIGTKKALLAGVFFLANLLLYSLPVYMLLRLVVRIRRRSRGERLTDSPPSPPRF